MPDREMVIKGLECRARFGQDGSCNGCAYFHPFSDDPDAGWCDSAELWEDALALLKEQEAVEPIHPETVDEPWFKCGACGQWVDNSQFRYCPWCGRKVNWSD